MPSYRAEVWFHHSEEENEDFLEGQLRDFMNANKMRCQGGPVVFRIYPNGEPGPDWSRLP